jgi:TonB family protein
MKNHFLTILILSFFVLQLNNSYNLFANFGSKTFSKYSFESNSNKEFSYNNYNVEALDTVKEDYLKTDTNEVFTIVEEMPEFPGGDQAMYKFIGENIKYPKEALKAGIQGVVFVNFIVNKDGSISGANVLRGIGGGCNEESLRVVNMMPTWKPGMQKGKYVTVQYNLPIRYILKEPVKKDIEKNEGEEKVEKIEKVEEVETGKKKKQKKQK